VLGGVNGWRLLGMPSPEKLAERSFSDPSRLRLLPKSATQK